MMFDYSVPGQVSVSMFNYLKEILTTFEKLEPHVKGTKSNAALENLFKVNQACKKFSLNKTVEFHNLVAKMLYATKCARPDTCTSIMFLTMRV